MPASSMHDSDDEPHVEIRSSVGLMEFRGKSMNTSINEGEIGTDENKMSFKLPKIELP